MRLVGVLNLTQACIVNDALFVSRASGLPA